MTIVDEHSGICTVWVVNLWEEYLKIIQEYLNLKNILSVRLYEISTSTEAFLIDNLGSSEKSTFS